MTDLFDPSTPNGEAVNRWLEMYAEFSLHTIETAWPDRARAFAERWADMEGEPQEPQLVRGPDATRAAHPSGRGQLFADYLEWLGTPPHGAAYPTFDWIDGPRWWPPLAVGIVDSGHSDA